MAQTHEGHDDTPGDDDACEEDARGQTLEEAVGDGLKEGVADEEDGERHVVIASHHAEFSFHVLETGISNVGSVEEGEEVEEREPRDEPQVNLPHQLLVLAIVSNTAQDVHV